MTADGEMIAWKGCGFGKFGPGRAVSYRGMLFYRTPSQKLAALNNACGAFEHEVDAVGNRTPRSGSGSSRCSSAGDRQDGGMNLVNYDYGVEVPVEDVVGCIVRLEARGGGPA
jgi:hypothetical protein